MALERAEIVLPAHGPFDLRATVLARTAHPPQRYHWRDHARPALECAEQLSGSSVHLLRIRPASRGVVLEVTGRDAREIEVLAPLAARVRRALSLDLDLAAFHGVCAREPLLRPIARLGLGRMLRGTTVFEDVIAAMLASDPVFAAVVGLGRRCPARRGMHAFPDPATLARVPLRRLARITGSRERASHVLGLSRDLVAGRCDLDALSGLAAREAARRLRAIHGIGPRGVARLLLCLGFHDEAGRDRDARDFARSALGGDRTALETWLRRQAPWRGLALCFAPVAADPAVLARLRRERPPGVPASRAGRTTGRGTPRSRARAPRTPRMRH